MLSLDEDERDVCLWCEEPLDDDGIVCEESRFGIKPGVYCSVECMIDAS